MKLFRKNVVIIGGGAAGIFAALRVKELNPEAQVIVLEKSGVFLAKVRVSGGGRCNVTHACFEPKELIRNYPRGSQELLGPFYRFQPRDTVDWFESRGVSLKTEDDGRVFPTTDRSQTIIDLFLNEAHRLNINLRLLQSIESVEKKSTQFEIHLKSKDILNADALILATGSSPQGHLIASHLGHHIQPPVPSLFTFNVPTNPLQALSGVSVAQAEVSLPEIGMKQNGPLLITHFGFSGPAVLKLSAWAARELYARKYITTICINWCPSHSLDQLVRKLKEARRHHPSCVLGSIALIPSLPKNLWKALINPWGSKVLSHLSLDQMQIITHKLHASIYPMEGKTTHKEEFVTCGGVTRHEVDFRALESKKTPHLYFAGEILDIDGVTGGFNFQNAWTTGFIAGSQAAL